MTATELPSLFVVSLPRSLSCCMYYVARYSLGLREPSWTMDGEILNIDRMAGYRGPRFDESAKFTTREVDPRLFQQITDFLEQVASPTGFAYKDVVHPFVLSEWAGLGSFRVLRIKRNVADVAFSMLRARWYYPEVAVPREVRVPITSKSILRELVEMLARHSNSDHRDLLSTRVVDGLLLADRALDRIPAVTVDFDDLVHREDVLTLALQDLYPEVPMRPVSYFTSPFLEAREEVLQRRSSTLYQRVRALVDSRDMMDEYTGSAHALYG